VITFWFVCAVFIAIALAFVLPTFFERPDKSESKNTADRREANIAVYRDQLDELGADLRNGIITREQHDQDRDEIERRLLEDVSTSNKDGKGVVKKRSCGSRIWLSVRAGILRSRHCRVPANRRSEGSVRVANCFVSIRDDSAEQRGDSFRRDDQGTD